MGYLIGEMKKLSPTDPAYVTWELNNSIIMACLINSIETNINCTYLLFKTAKATWDVVKENYSDFENTSQVFEIKMKLKDIHQGSYEVTTYYNSLKILWQELDMYYEPDWGEVKDHVKFKAHLDKERLYGFLVGLNRELNEVYRELDEVRGWILGRRPLPSIGKPFAEVRHEKNRHQVMLGDKKEQKLVTSNEKRPIKTTAFYSKGQTDSKNRSRRETRQSKNGDHSWCNHCNKLGHSCDTCFHIHSFPFNWKSQNQRENRTLNNMATLASNVTTSTEEILNVTLTKTQLESLHKILNQSSN